MNEECQELVCTTTPMFDYDMAAAAPFLFSPLIPVADETLLYLQIDDDNILIL